MIAKNLVLPPLRHRTVRRELSLFREEEGKLSARALHLCERDGCLTVGEGAEKCADFAEDASLFRAQGQADGLFVYRGGRLYPMGEEQGAAVARPLAVFGFLSLAGEKEYSVLTQEGLCSLIGGDAVPVPDAMGGVCGCLFGERLYTASGVRLGWSKPLAPENWTESLQEAGHVDLPCGGDILAIVPVKGELCLFRRQGITCLKAGGDTLAFKATDVPFAFGTIAEGSVQPCGGYAVFVTERGIYRYDGTVTRLTGCGFSEVDLSAGIFSASDGTYCAAVTLRSGQPALWRVDPLNKRGCFLGMRASSLAGGDKITFADGGKLYTLTPRGMPVFGRRECTVETEPSLLGLSGREKFITAVTVEGRGLFRVEARGSRAPRAAAGRAGERLVFPCPVRGSAFAFELRTLSEDARIAALTIELEEEKETW